MAKKRRFHATETETTTNSVPVRLRRLRQFCRRRRRARQFCRDRRKVVANDDRQASIPEGDKNNSRGKPKLRTPVSGEASPPERSKKRSTPEGVAPRRWGAPPSGSYTFTAADRGRRSLTFALPPAIVSRPFGAFISFGPSR